VDAQWKKGFLELLVLASLKSAPSYGYKIIQDVSGIIAISESTLYPILKRLEQQELVSTFTEEFNSRLRRYYRITSAGAAKLRECRADFEETKKIYDYILSEGGRT
jgi:PadR family transcriptional regulator PadR